MNENVFFGKNTPVPIEAVLQSISKILHENIGNSFDLEITERDSKNFNGQSVHRIEINLTVEEPINPPNTEPEKQPAFSA